MDEQTQREVVEVYRQPERREVVETYTRMLPEAMRPRTPCPPPRRKSRKGLMVFLLCLAVAAAAAGFACWQNVFHDNGQGENYDPYFENQEARQNQKITIPTYPWGQGAALTLAEDHGAELTIQEVYRKVNPSVVMVMAQLEDSVSVGTGVIFTSDGYILTNYHVIEGGSDCSITLDTGRTFAAKYVAGDQTQDLAVLKAEETGLPAAEFGNSDDLAVGDPVYAIGNPLGYELRGTLTDGIVSAINRDVTVGDKVMTLIQTNAALNFGNSGGPLINVYGQVVGINTIKMGSDYSNIEGLGFAIPSVSVEYLVGDLLTYGRLMPEPVLGITVRGEAVTTKDGSTGLAVLDVTKGSPADRAGIQKDDVLLQAGGQDMTASRDLLRVRNRCQIGDELTLTIWRDGETMEVTLLLDQKAES